MALLYLILFVILLLYLGIEYRLLSKSLRKISIRILVNGTRGKTTTVEIIHEILRQNGKKVFAKTTGQQPRELLPDGQSKEIPRHAPANIIESIPLLHRWARKSPDAVILECMALQPETQHTLAKRIFQPNYILFTNIYPDHREVMGRRIGEMAATLFQCILKNACLILPDHMGGYLPKKNKLTENMTIAQPETFPEKFDFIPAEIINQSWSLILALTRQFGIEPQLVHRCFRETWLSRNRNIHISKPELQWSLWNLFSVNDPQSAKAFIAHNRQYLARKSREIVLFNTRSDRPLRTADFVNLLKQEFSSADVWLTGGGRRLARRLFQNSPLNSRPVQLMSNAGVLQKLHGGFETPAVIYGIGNYYGMGEIVERVREMGS